MQGDRGGAGSLRRKGSLLLGVTGGLLLLGGLGRSGAAVRKPVVANRLASSVVVNSLKAPLVGGMKSPLTGSVSHALFDPAAELDFVWKSAKQEVYRSVPEL